MNESELLKTIQKGESSIVQFKEKIIDAYSIATEMVALSNSKGGIIIIGVDDKTGELKGLTYEEIQKTNNLLVDAATNNVKSPITIFTETFKIKNQDLIVVELKEGCDKPYKDNKGIIWIKNGSDKRKVISNDELLRLLQHDGNVFADEKVISKTDVNDVDLELFKHFFLKKTGKEIDKIHQSIPQILNNMSFSEGERLTLSGLLLFGKNPQQFCPLFTVQCISFFGNDINVTTFRDSEPPFSGNLYIIYEKTMSFLTRNLRKIQVEESVNSLGQMEVPKAALEEMIANALIHRDYFIPSVIKVFIFDDRIEIISPGKLPNTLTIEKIKAGTSIARNPILFSNARYLLPFIGVGTGIPRACSLYPTIHFINDIEKETLTVIIPRIGGNDMVYTPRE